VRSEEPRCHDHRPTPGLAASKGRTRLITGNIRSGVMGGWFSYGCISSNLSEWRCSMTDNSVPTFSTPAAAWFEGQFPHDWGS
jgi:hypothetical protein